MNEKARAIFNWIKIHSGAVSAITGVLALVMGIATLWLSSHPTSPNDPAALTAIIESFPYRHAETELWKKDEEWREKWSQPLKAKLKERGIAPEQIEIVLATMEAIYSQKIERESGFREYSVAGSEVWYTVKIRNDGDRPLKDVFLRFRAAKYWVDESHRLTFVPERIEIGDMDQKSEKNYTFWGKRLDYFYIKDDVVLGHSNGLGIVEFK
jgi:hypothetical protein